MTEPMQWLKGNKKLIAWAVALTLAGGGGYGLYAWRSGQALEAQRLQGGVTREITVKKATITEKVTALGVLEPLATYEIKAKTEGTVTGLAVKETEEVKAGQVLAVLASESLNAEAARAVVTLKSAQASLEKTRQGTTAEEIAQQEVALRQAEINLARSQSDLEKNQRLYENGAIPLADLEKAQDQAALDEQTFQSAQLKLAQLKRQPEPTDVTIAEAKVEEARISRDQALQNQNDARIAAPVDGTILSLTMKNDDSVANNTVVATVANLKVMRGNFYVNEIDVPKVKLGMAANVKVDALGGRVFKGKVTQIGQNPKTIDNVVNYQVLVEVDNLEGQLRSGMTMSVEIVINQKQDVAAIPLEALIEREGTAGVMIPAAEEGGRPTFKRIKTGLRDDTMVEVVEGLAEGDRIAIVSTARRTTTTGGNPLQSIGGAGGGSRAGTGAGGGQSGGGFGQSSGQRR
ncbi:efflux RND transporter periplasmic adaptor subunit [Heliobacterium undosum]|uniref:Efflux RND transporter periplasmic adaptor subunit n=1 Tax=Heliomicrobium undosum TaxID=121734 RepID=A0A845L3I4_9FIRM|nr:efflux RND transporter periplasmic adaptor subunit [Heliomicrobium undosum]MZP28318.1 efflux RND transporter periplasmic adaptor subunit [Heliomicrobium undosum]